MSISGVVDGDGKRVDYDTCVILLKYLLMCPRHVPRGFSVRLMVRNIEKAAEQVGEDFEIVQGDITDRQSVGKSLDGCIGVHINLSGELEQSGVEMVSSAAAGLKLQRITYISGTSVAIENIWVPLIRRKFLAERAICESGVPYTIFCPTWFMEILPRYIRGNRAFVFGKQLNPYHLIAADDYAKMVAASYDTEAAIDKRFIIHGPEGVLFHEAVKRYCAVFHPKIKKVSTMPYWFATAMAKIKGAEEMRSVSDFMAAFEKIGERGDPAEANAILGRPATRLDGWFRHKEHIEPKIPAAAAGRLGQAS